MKLHMIPFSSSLHHSAMSMRLGMVLVLAAVMTLPIISSRILCVESSCSPSPVTQGWSRRRITKAALSSAISAGNNPVTAISEIVSSKRRKNGTTEKSSRGRSTTSQQQQQQALSIPQRLISGGCSRGIAQMVMYPMDALRTLAQTRDGRTLADVGVNSLIRGCATTSSFAVLIGSIQFAIFGMTRNSCGPVLSSALGAAGSCFVSVPQEVIKQRLVTGVYKNFRTALSTIYKTDGVLGFYSAWRPTVARNVPFVVATFTSMDYLKQLRLENKKRSSNDGDDISLSVVENLAIGILSSLIGATLTHPGKRKRQRQSNITNYKYYPIHSRTVLR